MYISRTLFLYDDDDVITLLSIADLIMMMMMLRYCRSYYLVRVLLKLCGAVKRVAVGATIVVEPILILNQVVNQSQIKHNTVLVIERCFVCQ